jgi:hypothetical protein
MVDSNEMLYVQGALMRLVQAAQTDRALVPQIREMVAQTGILQVFGQSDDLDVLGLLRAGGEQALRARLADLSLAELKQIVASNQYDPEKASARWRSAARFVDLIVSRAAAQHREMEDLARLEQDQQPTVVLAPRPQPLPGASWML